MSSYRGLDIVLLLLAFILCSVVALSQKNDVRGSSTGAAITSMLKEQTCTVAGCHDDGMVNTGSGKILIQAPMEYTPGEVLTFTVHVEEVGVKLLDSRWL